jgi:hypothetical protein
MGFTPTIPCTDQSCPLCHGKGKYYRLDFSRTPGIPLRPQDPLHIAPLEVQEIICLKSAFDRVLDSILDEVFRFPRYPDRMQGPGDSRSSEEVRISGELKKFLDERR